MQSAYIAGMSGMVYSHIESTVLTWTGMSPTASGAGEERYQGQQACLLSHQVQMAAHLSAAQAKSKCCITRCICTSVGTSHVLLKATQASSDFCMRDSCWEHVI